MKLNKILHSSLLLLAGIQISAGVLQAKHDRTDQDYSDKHFKGLSYVVPLDKGEDDSQISSNSPTFEYNDYNQPYSHANQQQMDQNYANQNYYTYSPRDLNANKQIENADWDAQMKAREAGNYPMNSQNYQAYPNYPSYPTYQSY